MVIEDRVVDDLIDYIEHHLEEPLNLEQVAKRIGYSRFHLNRRFAREVGCPIHQYIQKRRLSEAARKLVETNQPIVEIALESSYGSQQAFTLAFKQQFEVTPMEYRRNGQFNVVPFPAVINVGKQKKSSMYIQNRNTFIERSMAA